jgi:membrane-associated phospholipid phosphatase
MGRRSLTVCLVALALAGPARADRSVESPYDISLGFDAPFLGLGLVLWTTPTLVLSHQIQGPTCATPISNPCDPSTINDLDKLWIENNGGARTAADWMFAALPLIYLPVELVDYRFHGHWGAFFTDLVVFAEALSWNGVLDEVFRRAVRRPRPFLYIAGAQPDQRNNAEATFSYYSGHTAAMFTFTAFLTYTWWQRHPGSKLTWLILAVGSTVGLTEGVLRIAGGDHFLTDVVTGLIVGSNMGVLIPYLRKKKNWGPVYGLAPSASTSKDGTTMFSLSGHF